MAVVVVSGSPAQSSYHHTRAHHKSLATNSEMRMQQSLRDSEFKANEHLRKLHKGYTEAHQHATI